MRTWFAALLVAALALTLAGCPADTGGCPPGTRCADVPRVDGVSSDARTDGSSMMDVPDPRQREIMAIAIDPPSVSLTSLNGATPSQRFTLRATRRDGSTTAWDLATWTLDTDRFGRIDNNGLFTANGIAAGVTQVRAEATVAMGVTLNATATVNVRIDRTVLGTGVPMEAPATFDAAGTAMRVDGESPVLRYPLNDALMPNNVAPPEVQWDPIGAPTDVFRVTLRKTDLTVRSYAIATAGFRHGWLVPREAWRSVLESNPNEAVEITVERLRATGGLFASVTARVRIAHGPLFGVMYYWDLSDGYMRRVNAVTAERENFMPNPPARPSDGRRCVACHTISRNGQFLSAQMWDGGDQATVFDLTQDLSVDPAPTVYPLRAGNNWLFSSFNPDATRLLANTGTRFDLINPRDGSSVVAVGLPGAGAAHPEWSPDGRNIAYAANIDGGWAVDFRNGDLALLPAGAGDTFAAPTMLVTGASLAGQREGGAAISHPTWSPDSRLVAFAHGTHSRSNNGATDEPGALYLITSDASGAPTRLNNANGGADGVASYWPTFSPFTTAEADGTQYMWLAYYSRRDYGNGLAGSAGSRRRQLWVTAIRRNAMGGVDPSNVPYWVPGQDVATENMAAYWAPQPCRMNGNMCTTSADCCSGRCSASGRCEPPPPAECRRDGQTCGSNGDCCMGLLCVGNVCQSDPG